MKDAGMDIFGEDDALNQHGVDGDTNHHEKTLKTQGCQVAQVVVTHLTPFTGVLSRGVNDKSPKEPADNSFEHAFKVFQNHNKQRRS